MISNLNGSGSVRFLPVRGSGSGSVRLPAFGTPTTLERKNKTARNICRQNSILKDFSLVFSEKYLK